MANKEQDKKAAMEGDVDRQEPVGLMEPMLIATGARHRGELTDLAIELAAQATGFRRSLPAGVHRALADLVRSMNCYYSNLIEGHDTHPVDIERALKDDYSKDARKRNLQKEALAHIGVQAWIDEGGLAGRATTVEGLQEIHERFCRLLPEELLHVDDPDTQERLEVTPGALRERDVRVGRHVRVSPGALHRFLTRFEQAYSQQGKTDRILSTPAAHHRLLWIHPFLDGNGRVARLMSHAMLLEALDTGGVWSVARGLARHEVTYKQHLANCDLDRRNDLDGRGTLSEESLAEFSKFFLEVCLDEITFMEGLTQPNRLRERILRWVEEEHRLSGLPRETGAVLEAVLYRGELPRGEVPTLLGYSDRQARRFVAELTKREIIASSSTRAPLRLHFPARLAPQWMPGLFPAHGD